MFEPNRLSQFPQVVDRSAILIHPTKQALLQDRSRCDPGGKETACNTDMEKSGKTRRVTVFQSEGGVIYDQVDQNITTPRREPTTPTAVDGGSSVSMSRPIAQQTLPSTNSAQTIPADKLWKLIKVFAQFSRDVQGGNVRRLIFRSPKSYAPPHNRFEPDPASQTNRSAPVTIIYLAFSERYAVAVTERLTGEAASTPTLLNSPTPVFTVPEFCNDILNFLHEQHNNVHVYSLTSKLSPPMQSPARSTAALGTSTPIGVPPDTAALSPMRKSPLQKSAQSQTTVYPNSTKCGATPQRHDNSTLPGAPKPDGRILSHESSGSRISVALTDPHQPNQQPPPLPPLAPQIDYPTLDGFIKNSQNLLGT